jgi:hypothetical protein
MRKTHSSLRNRAKIQYRPMTSNMKRKRSVADYVGKPKNIIE